MRLLIDDIFTDHLDCSISRALGIIGQAEIKLFDFQGADRETYEGKYFKRVDIRHNTFTPLNYYQEAGACINQVNSNIDYMIIDPISFSESGQIAYYDSICLRNASHYDKIMTCWESFNADTVGGNPDTNWTVTEDGTNTVTILQSEGRYSYVCELDNNDGANGVDIDHTPASTQANGTVYVIMNVEQADCGISINLEKSGARILGFEFSNDGNWYFYDSTPGWNDTSTAYRSTAFYIIKIEFECGAGAHEGLAADTFNVKVYDGDSWVTVVSAESSVAADNIDKIVISGASGDTGVCNIAAVDTSWASGYSSDRILTISTSSQYGEREGDEIKYDKYNMITEAWENFTDDTDFGNPATNWTTSEAASTNIWVLPRFDGYDSVLEFYDNAGAARCYVSHAPASAKTSGTCYFLVQAAQANLSYLWISFFESSTEKFKIDFDGSANLNLGASNITYTADTWYYLKLTFDAATDIVGLYYWNNHGWTTISEVSVSSFTEIDEIQIRTNDGGVSGKWYVAAVDLSWESGHTADDILYLTSFDIRFIDSFNAYSQNTYRVYYSSQLREIPRYYLDTPYDDISTSGTDPLTITTKDGEPIIDLTETDYSFVDSHNDIDGVDWLKTANMGVGTFPAFGAATRGNSSIGNIAVENWMFNSANEYFCIVTYKNGLQKITVQNDATFCIQSFHTFNTAGSFVDQLNYRNSGWQTANATADITVDVGSLFNDDTAHKDTIWLQLWDQSVTNGTKIRLFVTADPDWQFYLGYGGAATQLTANTDFVFWNGILDVESSAVADKRTFTDDLYNLYIGSSLTVGSLGSRTTNTTLNYRLFVGELIDVEYENHELILIARDYLESLKKIEHEFCSILNHKTSKVISVDSETQLTVKSDHDGNSVYDHHEKWDTDDVFAADELIDYGLVIVDKTTHDADYIFSDSMAKIYPASALVAGHDNHIYTHGDAHYVEIHDLWLGDFGIDFDFKSPVDKANVTAIDLDYRAGAHLGSGGTLVSFKIRIYNFDTPGWEDWVLGSLGNLTGHASATTLPNVPPEYVQGNGGGGNDVIRLRVWADKRQVLDTAWMRIFYLKVQLDATAFAAAQYPITDNAADTIVAAAATFQTDGISVDDLALVCPKNEIIIKTLIDDSPDLYNNEVATLTYYSALQMKGATTMDILTSIKDKEEGAQFWVNLNRELCFKTSFSSLGLTLGTDVKVYRDQYNAKKSPKELVNRVKVVGRDLGDGTILESDWYEDTTSMDDYKTIQKIIDNEVVRNKAEANAYAEKYLADHKDLKLAMRAAIKGEDENWIKEDILGKTIDISVDNISETTKLIEGVTWKQRINGDLMGSIRIGEQPLNLEPLEELAMLFDRLERDSREIKSARMSN